MILTRVTRWVEMEIRTLGNFESEHLKKVINSPPPFPPSIFDGE